jgi:hypothetical protein
MTITTENHDAFHRKSEELLFTTSEVFESQIFKINIEIEHHSSTTLDYKNQTL